jgi:methyl-galactoside transport system permease protein
MFKNIDAKKIKEFLLKYAIFFVLFALIVVIAIIDINFLSFESLKNILMHNSTRVIIALGAAFILITGGVDLSAGRMVGLAAVLSASMLQAPDYGNLFYPNLPLLPLIVPILGAVFVGIIFGVINGTIVSKLSVPPFIATLGTMVIILGANSLYFGMPPNNSQPLAGLRKDFSFLGSGYLFGTIPVIIIFAVVIAVIVWIIFNKTTLGKNMYAIGGNINAAKVSGINVVATIIIIYGIAGALYGFAGVLEAARAAGATNRYGEMYELDAIAACVVGGVSTTGGIGTVPGIVVGVLIFGVINYGLTFIGVSPNWQLIIKGLIIVTAVAFDIRKYITKK